MKKLFPVAFLCMLLLLCGISANAADDSGMWEYTSYGSGVQLTSYKGTQTDVYVPNSIEVDGEKKSVLKLGDNLFKGNTSLNSATLGEGIVEIGASAFEGATNLVCIVTPESLSTIGDKAFSGCASFNSVILYNGVTTIGENAFEGCAKVTIYCYTQSVSYNYAVINRISYKILNDEATIEMVTIDGVDYYIQNGAVHVVAYDNSVENLVIPATVKDFPVTDIRTVFKESKIKSITLPNTIRTLRAEAFENCDELVSVSLPDCISEIGESTFRSCDKLINIHLPDSIITINQYAFANCSSLNTINIPKNVQKIDDTALSGCYNMKTVYWDAESIADFSEYSSLFDDMGEDTGGINVIFGSTVKRIPGNLFTSNSYSSVYLNSVTFLSGNITIGKDAFIDATPKSVHISDISTWLNIKFENKYSTPRSTIYINSIPVTEVSVPEGTTAINDYAFYNCKNLIKITIPDSVNSIGDYAFSGTSITSIVLSENVTKIGEGVFYGCEKLTSATLPKNITHISNYLFYDTGLTNVTIAENITGIGDYAFAKTEITSIIIPENVTSIGEGVFYGCEKLTSATLPTGITYISKNMFCGTGFTSVTIPTHITVIGEGAYNYCENLEEVTIPEGVTNIEDAFFGCDRIKSVVIPRSVIAIKCPPFSRSTLICVYAGSFAHTMVDWDWEEFLYYVIEDEQSVDICTIDGVNYLLSNGQARIISFDRLITDIVIQERVKGCLVTSVDEVFSFSQITSISLPSGITRIGDYAFMGCTSLERVSMSDNVVYIGKDAFSGCYELKEIKLSKNLEIIEESAFNSCYNMRSIDLGEKLITIGKSAFEQCDGLESITIPASVTTISDNAFRNCYGFTSITINEGVTSIGWRAFSGCTSLTSVVIPKSATNINEYAFSNCGEIIFGVYENSFGYSFVVENELLYYITKGNSQEEICELDGVTYLLSGGEAKAVYYDAGYGTGWVELEIPEKVNGFPVTSIGKTFREFYYITSLTLPSTIVEIEDEAFLNCDALKKLVLPEGIKRIGKRAFADCWALTEINIPSGVTYIGEEAFANCLALAEINIPSAITHIYKGTFSGCESLTDIILPSELTHIGDEAFYGCKNLETISFPNKLIYIGEGTFEGCSGLKNLNIPSTVEHVGKKAFANCKGLENIFWDAMVADFDESPFYEAGSYYGFSVEFGDNVTRIPANLFGRFSNGYITKLVIPNNVKAIGRSAFDGIAGAKIYIPSITSWMKITFENLRSNPFCVAKEVYINNQLVTNIEIPDDTNTINPFVFAFCPVEKVTIPYGVQEIGEGAFRSSKITGITIPESVSKIGDDAFSYTKISSIVIPDTVSQMGNYVLSGSAITSAVLPENLTKINDGTFSDCKYLQNIEIPETVTVIGTEAFYNTSALESIIISENIKEVGESAFQNSGIKEITIIGNKVLGESVFSGCSKLISVKISGNISSIPEKAFEECSSLRTVRIPGNITSIGALAIPETTVMIVDENSYAHTFALENDLLYFVISSSQNPEITYGAGISGTATYTDGTAAVGATVEILYDDGTVKETVTTDADGNYEFTYAEVGRYTIRATDSIGNTTSEIVSVKRMNVFDVYVAGETNLVLKKGYSVSGTVSPTTAKITISDTNGNIIKSIDTTNGAFSFADIPRGTYIIKAENGQGSITTEIYVSNEDITGISLVIEAQSATISGDTKVENRDGTFAEKIWIKVELIDADGNVVAHTTTDDEGKYAFENITAGNYKIVATTNEMRPDLVGGFDKSHELKGYGHIDIAEPGEYTVDTIILREEEINRADISGKVTANGTTQDCQVILTNGNGDQIAVFVTDENGKYSFINIPDGMYSITAITKADGMGYTVISIENGVVYGDTDIKVAKSDKISKREGTLLSLPDCNTKEEALLYREVVMAEKQFYDSLSDKEKKQLSEEWAEKLFKLIGLLSESNISSTSGVTVENVESVLAPDEIEEQIEFELAVEEIVPDEAEEGITTEEEYETEKIKDKRGKNKNIAKYYDITFSKDGQNISNIQKQTETNGKLRITMEIPEEYKGYKHYSFIHMHKGEAVTLVDLDNDPDTVTFEIDKFSTFALAYSDLELIGEVELEEEEEEEVTNFGTRNACIRAMLENNTKCQVTMLSGIDSLNYRTVGFEVTVDGKTRTFETKTVYTSVSALSAEGKRIKATAGEFGGNSKYIFGAAISFGETFKNETLIYRPYAVDFKGNYIYGKESVISPIFKQ